MTYYTNWQVTTNEIIGAVVTEMVHDLRVNNFTFTGFPEVTISDVNSEVFTVTMQVKEFDASVSFEIDNQTAKKAAKNFQNEKRTGGDLFKRVQKQLQNLEQKCKAV